MPGFPRTTTPACSGCGSPWTACRSATPSVSSSFIWRTSSKPWSSGRRPAADAVLGPDSKAKLRKVLPQTRLTPSTAFDAVEADFFAREADLYKKEDVDSFDDLDRGGLYRPKPKKR